MAKIKETKKFIINNRIIEFKKEDLQKMLKEFDRELLQIKANEEPIEPKAERNVIKREPIEPILNRIKQLNNESEVVNGSAKCLKCGWTGSSFGIQHRESKICNKCCPTAKYSENHLFIGCDCKVPGMDE